MKKILLTLLTVLLLTSISFATEVGFSCIKQVNGDYKESIDINLLFAKYGYKEFYPQAYLNTSAVFLAPRANIQKPNHEYFAVIVGAVLKLPTNALLDISTGARYWWSGNSQGYSEGLIIDTNQLSIRWEF